ncbi:hypothetical protein CQW23_16445 [Capsicum baccatum]|uniref:Ubiquitin-like protease family profile domain-containing protein n=1 Tax=Capsicum baccatum TaxID=33114 RepID=A0A2G2WBE3_CAPBA|nr:hypothetical protein CQW23_16445 [Capsicum baccatum]
MWTQYPHLFEASGSSFNLGLTQIESTSNEINIAGCVLGSFAYEDVGFHENRFKHRNNPTIMQKLWDAATVKGKKTVVAISKGKRKKEMKYVIKTVPHHPLRFGISFNRNFVTDVEYFVVDELKCLQLSNNDGTNLKDSINSNLSSTSSRHPIIVDQKAKMTVASLLLDDFDNFTTPPPLGLLSRSKSKSDILLAPPSKRRKTDAKQTESVTNQENINPHLSAKEVNESPSRTSNTITDPINEEAPRELSLMDFSEQTPPAEQNPAIVKSVVIEIDSSNKDVEKNETHCDDLKTLKEHPKDVPEKIFDGNVVYTGDHKRDEKPSNESSHKFNFDDPAIWRQTIEVQNVQKHTIDNTITDFSSPVSAIQSEELLQKENLPDLILPTKNTEVPNKLQVSCIVISSETFQEVIDNIIAGKCTPITVMAINSDDLSQKVNLPDLSLQTVNVEVSNELRHVDVIFYYLRKKSKQQKDQEYRYTTVNCLFKTYIDATYKHYFEEATGDSLSTQDDYKKMYFVASNEGSLINIIKGLNIPAALPWHLVNDIYVPVNCDENFHWVLAVISLKKRCIRVYDSMLRLQHREPSNEIKRLSVMLPTYFSYSEFLKNTERTVWSSLEAYTDKMSKVIGDLNETPFDVEYGEDIAQQVSESLDCGVFVAAYAEFLSDQMQISSSNLDAEYL